MQNQLCKTPSNWTLTDDSSHQHVRKLDERTFELIEMGLVNPEANLFEVYTDAVCLDDYQSDEIKNILATFGYRSVREVQREYKEKANQVIAECIFEYFGSFSVEPLSCDISEGEAIRLIDDYIGVLRLYTKEELLHILKENSATAPELFEIGEKYKKLLGYDPIWNYHLSDDLHEGGYIVPVKEGWLFIPYNEVYKEDYEQLLPDEACLMDVESCDYFAQQLRDYADGLCAVLDQIKGELETESAAQSAMHRDET